VCGTWMAAFPADTCPAFSADELSAVTHCRGNLSATEEHESAATGAPYHLREYLTHTVTVIFIYMHRKI